LLTAEKDSAYREINTSLEQLLSSDGVQADDYATAYHLYLKMNEWDKAESAMTTGARKFPESSMAMQLAKSRFYSVHSSADSMIIHYQQFKRRFRTTDVQSISAGIQDRMLGTIANLYADSGDYQKFMTFISQTGNPLGEAGSCWFIANDLIRLNKNIPFANSLLKRSLELVKQTMNHPEQWKKSYQTNQDWEYEMKQTYAEYADDYASLLNKEGKIKNAVAYQKQAVDYLNGEGLGANEHYIQYLTEEKDYKLAQKELEDFIINGRTTDKMNAYLKPLYIQLNHSGKGYADYHRRLEEMADAKLVPDLIKEQVNTPAPDFKLHDLEGKEVSLAALKGKVVILDFWATWCPPCKASFPGMLKVVDDFKTDSQVVFLFINTLENTSANPGTKKQYRQVADFMTKHNYSLQVLLDRPKMDDSTQYQVMSEYHVEAIPTKVVIDLEGYIRFKEVGFYNTPIEIKEISLMVKMAAR
jgi:thiol-disulfide isomerase/thioredoxin